MTVVRLLILGVSCLVLPACDESVTGPSVPLAPSVTLAPGQVASVDEARIRVQFHGVAGDSRCPADAVCIQGGDALVQVSVLSGGARRDYELHTGSMQPVRHDDVTIALLELAPYPFSSRTIQADEYRATLQVTR
jgi:hypothetical protein